MLQNGEIIMKQMKNIIVSVTNECNLSCNYCFANCNKRSINLNKLNEEFNAAIRSQFY